MFTEVVTEKAVIEGSAAPSARPASDTLSTTEETRPEASLTTRSKNEDAVVLRSAQIASSTEQDDSKESEKRGGGGAEEASSRVAQSLEDALNSLSGKSLRFQVSVSGSSKGAVNFSVVEKDSGEVIKEFPAKEVKALSRALETLDAQGVLVDQAA